MILVDVVGQDRIFVFEKKITKKQKNRENKKKCIEIETKERKEKGKKGYTYRKGKKGYTYRKGKK